MGEAGTQIRRERGAGFIPAAAVGLLLGVLAVQCLPRLPPVWLPGVGVLAAWLLLWRRPGWRVASFVLMGLSWCAWRADLVLVARLPRALDGCYFDYLVLLNELQLRGLTAWPFTLRIERATLDGVELPLRGRVRVSWYD